MGNHEPEQRITPSHIQSAHFAHLRDQNEQIRWHRTQNRPQNIRSAQSAIPRTQNEQIRWVAPRCTPMHPDAARRNPTRTPRTHALRPAPNPAQPDNPPDSVAYPTAARMIRYTRRSATDHVAPNCAQRYQTVPNGTKQHAGIISALSQGVTACTTCGGSSDAMFCAY